MFTCFREYQSLFTYHIPVFSIRFSEGHEIFRDCDLTLFILADRHMSLPVPDKFCLSGSQTRLAAPITQNYRVKSKNWRSSARDKRQCLLEHHHVLCLSLPLFYHSYPTLPSVCTTSNHKANVSPQSYSFVIFPPLCLRYRNLLAHLHKPEL